MEVVIEDDARVKFDTVEAGEIVGLKNRCYMKTPEVLVKQFMLGTVTRPINVVDLKTGSLAYIKEHELVNVYPNAKLHLKVEAAGCD